MSERNKNLRVLVVEDDMFSRRYFDSIVSIAGFSCKVAEDGEQGLQIFKEYQPHVVLSDIQMPGMSGLAMLEEIRKQKSDAIVIMTTAFDSEEYAIKALQLGANNYLKKPVHSENLKRLLRKYWTIIQNQTISNDIVTSVLRIESTKQFLSDMDRVPMIVDYLIRETQNVFEDNERIGLELGLVELIANAVEHGNLNISYTEKSQALDENRLSELYAQKLLDPEIAKRHVTIDFKLLPEYCEWIITDEGKGFDWRNVQNPLRNEGILKLHGRGIFISRFQFDELEYLGSGNSVRVKKYRVKPNNELNIDTQLHNNSPSESDKI